MPVTFQSTEPASPLNTLVVASDTVAGVDYQKIKLVWGTTGIVNEISTGVGLPVVLTAATSALDVTQASAPWSVTLTSGTVALGSVGVSSGTVTATLSSGTQVIGSVNQGTSPWVTSLTSGILPLGSVTVTSGTIASLTSGTVTLTSGALALGSVSVSNITSGTVSLTSGALPLGTVTLSSGAVFIGDVSAPIETTFFSSGVLKAPVIVSATSSSSFYLLFTSAAATSNNRIVSASLSRTSSTEAIYGLQFMTSAAVALTGKIFMPPTPSNTVILPLNLAGWAQTTTTAIYVQTGVQLSTNSSVTATYIPL